MNKRISPLIIAAFFSVLFFVQSANANPDTSSGNSGALQGQFFDIKARNSKVTDEYCKNHTPDTFTTTHGMEDKKSVGANGVTGMVSQNRTKQVGGVYLREGTANFSGEENGKKWSEKVWYYGQILDKETGIEQGIWYTKDCKGFYKVGPAS